MKWLRIGFAMLTMAWVMAAAAPLADEGEDAKCDCWYWQSNKYGLTKVEKVDGKDVEKCDTEAKCDKPKYD